MKHVSTGVGVMKRLFKWVLITLAIIVTLVITHVAAFGIGFSAGIYLLPILSAPGAPPLPAFPAGADRAPADRAP